MPFFGKYFVDNYASGVRRIFEDYSNFPKEPYFYISDNGVIVTLFNRNYEVQTEVQTKFNKISINERRKNILKTISENPQITSETLKDILGVSKATIERDIAHLREADELKYVGGVKRGYWVIKNKK